MSTTGKARDRSRTQRGAAMVMALALTLCLTMFIVATQLETVTELKVSKTERDYERALELAEAGANAYLSRLNFGAADTSPNKALLPPLHEYAGGAVPTTQEFKAGVLNGTYTLIRYPAGSQQGYYAGTIGTPGQTARIVSYGWSNGVVRRVVVTAPAEIAPAGMEDEAQAEADAQFTLFAVRGMTVQNNTTIHGVIGTSGTITVEKGNFTADGIDLYGDATSLDLGKNPTVGSIRRLPAIRWPTVAEVALKKFPQGGLSYLRSHNDNSMATVGTTHLSGTVIDEEKKVTVTFYGKSGGANYYLTNVHVENGAKFKLDTSAGPICIWLGPTASGDTSGGWTVKNNANWSYVGESRYQAALYIGTAGGLTGKNNLCSLSVYAHNDGFDGKVELRNNGSLSGRCVADMFTLKNNSEGGTGIVSATGPCFTLPGFYEMETWTE